MFGFLSRPCQTCSSQDDLSTYRSFFCGLSTTLCDEYSPAARFLVNRDSTFLSLLTASISPQRPTLSARTCCNPIAVPKPLFSDDLHSQFAAAVTVCGLAAKLEDDRVDEKGLRKNAARFLGHALGPMKDRAISFLNSVRFPTSEVVEMLAEQSAIESRRPDLLTAASPTAAAYGTIFSEGARLVGAPREQSRIQKLGENLGRLIYWRDAFDDREADAQRGRYNPLERSGEGEFENHFSEAFTNFEMIAGLPGSFQETVSEVCASTYTKHQSLVPSLAQPKGRSKKQKRRKKGKPDRNESFCDRWCHCDCCPSTNCNKCDSACDCGPGDSGCCPCDCSP